MEHRVTSRDQLGRRRDPVPKLCPIQGDDTRVWQSPKGPAPWNYSAAALALREHREVAAGLLLTLTGSQPGARSHWNFTASGQTPCTGLHQDSRNKLAFLSFQT